MTTATNQSLALARSVRLLYRMRHLSADGRYALLRTIGALRLARSVA